MDNSERQVKFKSHLPYKSYEIFNIIEHQTLNFHQVQLLSLKVKSELTCPTGQVDGPPAVPYLCNLTRVCRRFHGWHDKPFSLVTDSACFWFNFSRVYSVETVTSVGVPLQCVVGTNRPRCYSDTVCVYPIPTLAAKGCMPYMEVKEKPTIFFSIGVYFLNFGF